MEATDWISQKINEIIAELKQLQLWRKQAPEWVTDFSHKEILSEEDFAGWLQFVWLPNFRQNNRPEAATDNYIAPQARRFFGEDIRKGRLLQLLIELDSLS
jgi:uncharacterized protein YqcC (DUF446 family)